MEVDFEGVEGSVHFKTGFDCFKTCCRSPTGFDRRRLTIARRLRGVGIGKPCHARTRC